MSVAHNEVTVSPSALMNIAEDHLPLSSSGHVYQPVSHGEMASFGFSLARQGREDLCMHQNFPQFQMKYDHW